ncbi:MAG: septum formation initiator family protein [Chloroflexi bacterium]|jgi:cell division protein FtsB|nr:septum formation initiator family protein [Chloroflexota bacterium]
MPNIPINFRRVATFAGILILVLLVIEFNTRLEELNRLNDQRDEIRAQATQAMQTQIALQTQVAYAGSDAAVEEWARTEGHYIKEGDQPVIPVGQPGSEPVIVNTPPPVPTPMQNWEEWWNLFFGK